MVWHGLSWKYPSEGDEVVPQNAGRISRQPARSALGFTGLSSV